MDIRDFEIEIEEGCNSVIISQQNPQAEDGKDKIWLSLEQVDFFIEILNKVTKKSSIKKKEMYTGVMNIEQDNVECSIPLWSDSVQGLYEDRKFLYDSLIENAENIPYQIDNTNISNIKKITYIEEE